MLTQSYSESFYNLLLGSLRENTKDPYLPPEDVEKANKLIFLLAKKVDEVTDESGEKEMQITWYERTSSDLVMQVMYAIKREREEKAVLEQTIRDLKEKVASQNKQVS